MKPFFEKVSFADPSLISRCTLLVGGLLYLGVVFRLGWLDLMLKPAIQRLRLEPVSARAASVDKKEIPVYVVPTSAARLGQEVRQAVVYPFP